MRRAIVWDTLLIAAGGLALISSDPAPAWSQAAVGTVQGTVIDAGSGRKLPNAQVIIGGTRLGSLTNEAGDFHINGVPAGAVTVQVRLIGYAPANKPATVTAGQTVTVNFTVAQSAVTLSDVVVTGTGGAVEEKKLGNTVAKVDLSDIQHAPVTSTDEVLQGRVPGVSLLPSGGATGQGARIRIRGNASLSQTNNPIIYIDGVRADNGGGFGNSAAPPPSRLDDIDPQSIERIEIAKGAAAATLYGTEASNGVIQIFTKKGSISAPRWNFQLERSLSQYPTDRIRPNTGFARTQAQADSLSAVFKRPITPFTPFAVNVLPELFDNGYGNIGNGSVSGGADKITYFISGRYAFEDGPFTAAPFNGNTKDQNRRYQGTVNLTLSPRDNLHLGFRTFYSDGHLEGISGNNNIYSPNALALYAKPERAYCLDSTGTKHSLSYISSADRCARGGNPFGNTAFATVGEALQSSIYQDETHFNGALNASYVPVADLTLDATVGLDNVSARSISFLPFGNAIDNFTNNAPNGSRSLDVTINQNVTLELKGSWNKQLTRRLNSTLVFGGQGFITDTKTQGGSNQDFPGPGLESVGAGSQPSVYETALKVVNAGYFAQEQIGINNWIFVTGGTRFDYNSAFGQSAGGVLYPKLSISLVPSDRQGWTSTTFSAFRLRAAIGKAGRQPGAFDKFTTYRSLPSQFGGGLYPANLGNQNLKPEVSTETELGAELGLFNNKISTSVTYWTRDVTDALVSKQFPISGGFTQTQLANVGAMKAHGTELNLSGFVVNRPNLGVDVFANGAYIWQKVTSLGGAPPLKVGGSYIRYRNFIKEGYAPGAIFGAKLLSPCGSYSSAQAATLRTQNLCYAPGELPFSIDANGKFQASGKPATEAQVLAALGGPIDPGALVPLRANDACGYATTDPRHRDCGDYLSHYIGKPYPDWQGGFGGHVRMGKNWQVGTLFEYKAGNYTIQDLTDAFRQASPSIGRNIMASSAVEATLLNPASTSQQRLDAAKQWLSLVALSPYDGIQNQMSSGDFIRWRELSLTYTAPASLARRLRARDVALTVAARNLKLWTKYTGVDPEVNQQGVTGSGGVDANFVEGIDAYTLPLQRRFSLSIRLGY